MIRRRSKHEKNYCCRCGRVRLAAAVRLQKLGYDVTLYEKEGQPGAK